MLQKWDTFTQGMCDNLSAYRWRGSAGQLAF